MVTDMIKQLLEAGVHFGHQTKKWNPKMAPYIFGQRNGVYIIDLEKTVVKIEEACSFLREAASKGENILFVGTKKQAKDSIISEAQRSGMFFVTERWLGGLLTNFATIKKSVTKMKETEEIVSGDGASGISLTKKEMALLQKDLAKLQKNLSGVADMKRLPGAVIIIDPKKEETAVREARILGIPTVALIDTNSNPDMIDYPIPGNDDAIRSIRLILSVLTNSILEGRNKFAEGKSAKGTEGEESDSPSADAGGSPAIVADVEDGREEDSEEGSDKRKSGKQVKKKKPQAIK